MMERASRRAQAEDALLWTVTGLGIHVRVSGYRASKSESRHPSVTVRVQASECDVLTEGCSGSLGACAQ
eukprot:1393055-Rhodomonas_salina.1